MDEFQSTFATEHVVLDEAALSRAEEDDFDPFQIGVASTNTTMNTKSAAAIESAAKGKGSPALPPRLMVKFQIHEEVSSVSHISNDTDGSLSVQIEGTLLAQVVSSDALKNIPFFLVSSATNETSIDFTPNDTYTKVPGEPNGEKPKVDANIVTIPKEILGFVKVGTYRISQSMEHMPLLLEQKVVRSNGKIQIAIQVRSKLSNPDDLSEFSIVTSIPDIVNEDSVEIVTGYGEFDALKRCITWEKDMLPKGQSFMVSAKCAMNDTPGNDALKFPVMLRCRTKDQISSIQFQAIAAEGHPATISSSVVGKSFRILHRLN
mmetsp:Transcript_935/g.1998  ORF Transcript_935/g.1998 Transcript_935/m.1998 type:complete len:319 (-) Transcript_935:395-1351(-)